MTPFTIDDDRARPFTASDLAGKTILVAGATGGVGEGMTRAFLRAGARVVAAGRDAGRLAALDARLRTSPTRGELVPARVDVTAEPEDVAHTMADHGPFAGAVITIGDWGPATPVGVLDTSAERWDHMISANLTAHFRALKSLVPLLSPSGALVHLSGFSAEIPYPRAALVGATNAAKKSLVTSLQAELAGRGPRVYELLIGPVRTRPRALAGIDDPGWYSGDDLGAHTSNLIANHGPHARSPVQYLLTLGHGVTTSPPVGPSSPGRTGPAS